MRITYLTAIFAAALLILGGRALAASEIPFEFRDGMIWVKVTSANRSEPLHFLLDSGASVSVLDLKAAQRLGAGLGSAQSVQGVHSRATAYKVRSFAAKIGGADLPGSLLAIDLSSVSATCHRRIDGLLGADFFKGRIVQIDFTARKVRILPRAELNPAGCDIIPLATRNGAPCVRVAVNDLPAAWTRVDTGCNSALQWVANRSVGSRSGSATIGLASGLARSMSADVQLGAVRFESVKIGVHSRPIFTGEAGLLGNELLSRFACVTFDPARKQLLLKRRS